MLNLLDFRDLETGIDDGFGEGFVGNVFGFEFDDGAFFFVGYVCGCDAVDGKEGFGDGAGAVTAVHAGDGNGAGERL